MNAHYDHNTRVVQDIRSPKPKWLLFCDTQAKHGIRNKKFWQPRGDPHSYCARKG